MSSSPTVNEFPNHLLIMRHGQAEVYADSDHQRSLTEVGRQELLLSGAELSKRLRSLNLKQLIILVSEAKRTQQTWDEIKPQIEQLQIPKVNVHINSSLYLASYEYLFHSVLEYLPKAEIPRALLLIGHNPGLSNLVNDLSSSWLSLQTGQWRHLASTKDLARWTLFS